ncbi:MAG: hypothetical protein IPM23_05900 [Candidatus Melainabacteria bacterium]|nr:hypothetical protein [Candidatus Melainabacteria bacterium]
MGDSIERANDATVSADGGDETSNRLLAAATDSSAVKPAGQTGNRLLSMSTSTGTPFVESSSVPAFDTVKRSLAGEATHSFFYSLAQRPVTGLTQVFDNTLGKPFNSDLAGSTKFMDAPKPTAFGSAEWHAQTIGGTAGMLPWFIGAFKVSKGALGGYRATAAEMTAMGSRSLLYRPSTVAIAEGATAGFLHDSLLAPTDPSAGNFFVERGKHGLVGAATFGTLTAATIGLKAFGAAAGETTLVGRAMESRIINPALAGVPAAFASEAAGVVVLGHDASLESLGKTTYTMVLVGGGLGAFHSVPGLRPARAAEGRSGESSAEARTGPEILSGKIEAARLEVRPVEKGTAGDRRIATPETALAGKETAAEPIKFNVTGDPAVVETFQRGANSAIRAVQEPTEANVATFKQFAAGEGRSMGTIMLEMANQLNSKAFVDLVRDAYKIDQPTALSVRGQALAKLAADPQSQQPSRTEPFFEYARNEGADRGPELLRYAQQTGNKRLEIVVKEAYLLKEGKTAPRSDDPVSLKLTTEQAQRFSGFVNLVKDLPMESGNYAQFRYNLFTWMNANPDLVPAVIDYAARHPASQIAGPVDYYAPEHSSSLRRFPTIEGVKAPEPVQIDSDPARVTSDFARPLSSMEGRGKLIYSRDGHGVYEYSNPAAEYKVLETRDGGQIFYYQTGGEKPGYATLIYMPDGRVGHRYTQSSETQFYEKSATGPSQLRQREGLDPDIVDWMTRVETEAGIKSTATSLSIPDGRTPVEPIDNSGKTINDSVGAADAGLPTGRRLWQLFAREQTPGHARQLTENFGDLSPAEFKQWLDYVTHRPEGLPAEAPPPNLAKLWVPSASVLAREPIIKASEASPEGKGPLESYHRFLSKPAKSIPDFPDWLAEFVRERFREAEATAPDGAKPHEILDLALPRQLSRYIRSNYMDINTTKPLENPASNTLPADIRAKFEAANQSDTRGTQVGRPPREEGNTVADRMDRLNELLDIPDATIRNRLIDLGGQDHPKLKNITSKLNPETAAPEYAELLKIMLPGAKNIADVTTVLDAIFNANKTRRNSPNSPEVAANEQLAMAALEGMVQDPAAMGRAQQIVHDMIVGKIRDPRPGGDFGGRGGPGGGRGGNQRDQRGGPRDRGRGDGGLGKQERTAEPPAETTQDKGNADAGQTNPGTNAKRTPETVVEPPVFEGSKNVAGGQETLVGPGKKVEAAPMNDMFDWSRPPQTEMERLLREAFLKRTRGKGKERSEDRGFEEEGDGRSRKEKSQGSKRRGGARNLTRDYLEGDFDGDGG